MLIATSKSLSSYCQHIRKINQATQSAVASMTGLRQASISSFETNSEKTSIETLLKIAAALDLEVHLIPKNTNPKRDESSENIKEEW